ncbi:TonB-dependent receptor domain-containing protein [Thauera sp.]|uniref:TonB-dependent receptor domain-containing protein n=1 Tax=Thauera sp. TaxID=1905334 RepID=UPI0039E41847
MKIRLAALVSACALAYPLAGLARSGDAQLDHVVVTATRQPVSADEVLSSVDVIDRDEIARAGNSNLVQLLSGRPGVQVTSNGGPGSNSSVFIRGTNSGHALLLIDGVRVGSLTSGAPAFENIPLELIERIEILRGPASALYGADAIGGVIQVFTRKGSEGFQPSARVGLGSDGARTLDAALAGGAGRLRYRLAAGHERTDGINAKPASIAGNDRDDDGFRNDYFSGSVSLGFREADEVGLTMLHSKMRSWYDMGKAYDSHMDKRTESIGLHMRNRIDADWTSTLRFGYGVDESDDRAERNSKTDFETTQRQLTWQHDIGLAGGTLLAAYEYLEQEIDSSNDYDKTGRHTNSLVLGWSGQFDRHHLQANARYDDNSQFGSKTTGTLAYGYRLTPEWRARVSIGTAFKAPTFNDLYYPWSGNPDLEPEEALNREAGLVWERGGFSFSATYFDNRVRNLIAWAPVDPSDPTGFWLPANVARASIEGLELAASAMVWDYRVRASIDFLDAEDKATGDELSRRARIGGSLGIERSAGQWTWGLEWNGQGRRHDSIPNTAANRLAGYGLLNGYVHYALAPEWSVELRANNILDKDYELASRYGTQGANAFIALRYAMH